MLLGFSFYDKIYFMFCFSVFLYINLNKNGRQIKDKFAVNLECACAIMLGIERGEIT